MAGSLVAVVLLAGCTDPAAEDAPGMDDAAEVVEEPVDEGTTEAADVPVDEGGDVDEEPDEVEVGESAPRPDLGLPAMILLTPAAGEGPRPVLRWEPVEAAASYAVTVYAGEGEPARWSWRGDGTSVRVGLVDDPTIGGPNVVAGMTWSVLALGPDDEPVAQSNERPLGP